MDIVVFLIMYDNSIRYLPKSKYISRCLNQITVQWII